MVYLTWGGQTMTLTSRFEIEEGRIVGQFGRRPRRPLESWVNRVGPPGLCPGGLVSTWSTGSTAEYWEHREHLIVWYLLISRDITCVYSLDCYWLRVRCVTFM